MGTSRHGVAVQNCRSLRTSWNAIYDLGSSHELAPSKLTFIQLGCTFAFTAHTSTVAPESFKEPPFIAFKVLLKILEF